MILLLNCGSSKVPYIEQMVDEFCDFKTIPILELNEDDLLNVNGIIISGAPLLITEQNVQPYLDKLYWIKDAMIPTLGICFGHQLIGLLFGAFGSRMREDRDWQTIEVFEESILFDKLPAEFEMMEDHCETISIPAYFKLLASSDACVNEAMQHNELPLFGVQFHPEVSGNFGSVLIGNFVNFCLKQV
jgi:GMP synthase (glutamine-hydrolysing)